MFTNSHPINKDQWKIFLIHPKVLDYSLHFRSVELQVLSLRSFANSLFCKICPDEIIRTNEITDVKEISEESIIQKIRKHDSMEQIGLRANAQIKLEKSISDSRLTYFKLPASTECIKSEKDFLELKVKVLDSSPSILKDK